MAILIIAPDRNTDQLKTYLQAYLPEVIVYNDPAKAPAEQVEMAVLWKQPPGILRRFPKLKAVHSLGAGVDHLISDPSIPKHLPIARIVDEELTIGMRRYVLMAVLNIHKNLLFHLQQQQKAQWSGLNQAETPLRIGVMGLGALGEAVAKDLCQLQFPVAGFSNSPKKLSGIDTFSAEKGELSAFLKGINTLVCLLPLTSATKDILKRELFAQLPDASYLINVGRGAHLVEEDLLWAFESGKIRGAYLDVLRKEPLPSDHPFWTQEGLVLTPHIASVTNQENAARQIAENYQRMQKGLLMKNQIDRQKGY
ncbi:MAG TPA: glyoxylate/hydroxypyruvate reductase A [Saprospiraceae bacterium]|nr:glyoxylate/hydroxypyruvate reductase A [Saprospiraceae bacterium]